MQADMIVTGARVLTMDPARPRAEAVALAQGRIVAVGGTAEVLALAGAGPGCRIIEAGGRSLLPGFVESHLHLGLGGSELPQLQLAGVHGFDAVEAAYRRHAEANPDLPLLMAQGAVYDLMGEPTSRPLLDRICPDRPIAMMAMDHHTVWANTMALRATGLLHGAEMPFGHEVVMGEDGLCTGELREFEAFGPIIEMAGLKRLNLGIATGEEPDPAPTRAEREADKVHLLRGLAHCAAHGITSMVNMDGNHYTCSLLAELEAEGRLTARVKVPFHFKPHMDLAALDRASAMAAEFQSDWLRSGFVKMFMDGVVDSRTAYNLNDYPGTPGHRGVPLFEPERFKAICVEASKRGLQIAVHAIGDGAVRATLDGYQAATEALGPRDLRHRVEHIELIDPADVPRLGQLGVVASLQPPHVPGVMDFTLDCMTTVYHRHRWRDAYVWRTLVEAGAPVAYASDWPVTDVSVMRGLQAALTRVPFDVDCRDERLSLHDSLRAYTAGGAWAAHMEAVTGCLKPGLAADLVLINGDIEAIPPDSLGETGIAMTIAGGRVVHAAADFA